jgi:hypothetical protein
LAAGSKLLAGLDSGLQPGLDGAILCLPGPQPLQHGNQFTGQTLGKIDILLCRFGTPVAAPNPTLVTALVTVKYETAAIAGGWLR